MVATQTCKNVWRGAAASLALFLYAGVFTAGGQEVGKAPPKPTLPVPASQKPTPMPPKTAAPSVSGPLAVGTGYPILLSTRPWYGVPTIPITLNGTSVTAAIGTGLSESVVIPRALESLGIKAGDKTLALRAFDETLSGPEALLPPFQLQAHTLTDVRVAVVDVVKCFTTFPLPDAPPVWLGSPFLSRYQILFDFPARAILLYPPEQKLPGGKGSVVVPIEMRDGRPWVKVAVPRLPPFWALLDTTTVGTLIPAEVGEKLKLEALKTLPVSHSDGEKAQVRLAVLPRISVGKAEQQEVPTLFLADKAPASFHRDMAILGTDFLSRYRVTLDYAKLKMVLQPPDVPKTPKKKPNPDEEDEAGP